MTASVISSPAWDSYPLTLPLGPPRMSIRILVYCDKPIICAGIRALLEQQEDLHVTAETSAQRALTIAQEESPAAIIVIAPALTIDNRNELAQLARLSKVVFLAKTENVHRCLEVLCVGVRAVLSVDSSADELLHVLRTVVGVDAIVIPFAAHRSLEKVAECRSSAALASRALENLTSREREVIFLLTQGLSNAKIADKLSITPATVRSHVHHLLRKLEVGTRAQAVAVAYETGLISAIEQHLRQPG